MVLPHFASLHPWVLFNAFSPSQLAQTPALVLFTWEGCGSEPGQPLTEPLPQCPE